MAGLLVSVYMDRNMCMLIAMYHYLPSSLHSYHMFPRVGAFLAMLLAFAGISMHKGYAFVQFASPFDARSACLGEDGRTISGQIIGEFFPLNSIALTSTAFLFSRCEYGVGAKATSG